MTASATSNAEAQAITAGVAQQHDQDVVMGDATEAMDVRHAAGQDTGVSGSGLGHAGDAGLPVPGPVLALSSPASPGASPMTVGHTASGGAADQVCVCSRQRAMAY